MKSKSAIKKNEDKKIENDQRILFFDAELETNHLFNTRMCFSSKECYSCFLGAAFISANYQRVPSCNVCNHWPSQLRFLTQHLADSSA